MEAVTQNWDCMGINVKERSCREPAVGQLKKPEQLGQLDGFGADGL